MPVPPPLWLFPGQSVIHRHIIRQYSTVVATVVEEITVNLTSTNLTQLLGNKCFRGVLEMKRMFQWNLWRELKSKAKLWHQRWHLCWRNNIRGPRRLSGTLLNNFPANVKITKLVRKQQNLLSHLKVFRAFALGVEKITDMTMII